MTDIETPELPPHRQVVNRSSLLIVSVTVLIMVLLMGIGGWLIYDAVKGQAERGTNLAQQVKDACSDPTIDTHDLGALCRTADDVVEQTPTIIEGTKGDKGDQGNPGKPGPPPSNLAVAGAVARFCSGGACDGKDGKNATAAQVAQAVARFCTSRGDCVGPPGADGADGTNGTNGSDGPPPTDAQVQAAVNSYCSQESNPCQGPKGDPGDPAPADGGAVDIKFANCTGPIKDLDQSTAQYDADTRVITITCP